MNQLRSRFGSILIETFRSQLRGVLIWGISLAIYVVLLVVLHWREEVPTPEARERLMAQIDSGGLGFMQILFGRVHDLRTFGGFAEWYGLGLMPLLVAFVMVLTATAVYRGAEERGEVELLLTAPHSRAGIFCEQLGGLALVLTVLTISVWGGLLISGPLSGQAILSPAASLLASLNVATLGALFGTLGVLFSQISRSRRAAASAAGALLVGAQLWANIGLISTTFEGWRWLSPWYLYSRSSPLTGTGISLGSVGAIALAASVCLGISFWFFIRRDIGSFVSIKLPLPARFVPFGPSRGLWLLDSGLTMTIRTLIGTSVLWATGVALYVSLFTYVTPAMAEALEQQPGAQDLLESLGAGNSSSDAGILSFVLFAWLPALFGLLAVNLAAGFAGEEQIGRYELESAYPCPRRTLYLSRFGASAVVIAVTTLATVATFLAASYVSGVDLPWSRSAVAAALLALPALVFLSFGFLLAGWRPSITGGVASAVLVASFFFDILAEPLDLPDTVRKVSVFQLYGRPLLQGINWTETAVMLALIVGFLIAGCSLFSRRDLLK